MQMNPPPVLIKTSRRSSSKKRKTQDLSTKPSALIDDEQIATQNLFNVANLQDSDNEQKKFNTTFDLFRSVNFNEESENDQNPDYNLIKTSRNDRQKTYYPDSVQLTSHKRFSTEKNKKMFIKNYDTVPETFTKRSQLLKIKRGKLSKMTSLKETNPSVFNEIKSNTVFVGKNSIAGSQQKNLSQNYFKKLLKNLSSPNKHTNCHRLKLRKTQIDDQRSLRFFQPKPLSINDQVKSYIIKQSPQSKNKILYQHLIRNQRLERLKKTISQETNDSNSHSIGKDRKNFEIKNIKNLDYMNNRILGLDEFADYSFRSRHSNYKNQRK